MALNVAFLTLLTDPGVRKPRDLASAVVDDELDEWTHIIGVVR
jgi:hypothetical protein